MDTERVHLDWRFRLGWIATYVIGWELIVQLIGLVVRSVPVAPGITGVEPTAIR